MIVMSHAKRNEWLGRAAEWVCPPELATTDRICQRWAVSVGMGLPTDQWMDCVASRPPPLDDVTAIVVDQIILKSPEKTKRVVVKWYRTQLPQPIIAEQLGLTERTLVTACQLSLNYLQWRFLESKSGPLLALLRLRA
jgi:hypothetical protein